MRSSDKPFYNTNVLHLLFAVASVALLAVTVWMVVADHRRQWKEYQRTYREKVEPWLTAAELQENETAQSAGPGEDRRDEDRLRRTLRRQSPTIAKDLFQSPFLDAFGGPLAVQQYWLPELTIDYHFRQVARFDRCTTCHFGIDRSRPGTSAEPAVPPSQTLHVQLKVPLELVEERNSDDETKPAVRELYGIEWADRGILEPTVPTIGLVLPRSVAAMGLLESGDALAAVNGTAVDDLEAAIQLLLDAVNSETAPRDESDEHIVVDVTVRRGLARPYCSHPRLDLFVGASSPHPAPVFGCTVCHDGQGTATAFEWASHSPNDPEEAASWRDAYGWSRNPHWERPMMPGRFAESRCLRCHHDVVELEASRRYPDPPAPSLVAGYHLVRENGCFGCHEIKGTDAAGRAVGPDLRLEPNYAEAALGLLATGDLDEAQAALAERIVADPDDAQSRRRLVELLDPPEKTPETARLAAVLADVEVNPGSMRKVGPSLRDTPTRLSEEFLVAWTADPASYRSGTRMPSFYRMHGHLSGEALEEAKWFEPVELLAMAEYLRSAGGTIDPLPPGEEEPSAEEGERLFQTQGCLACHTHEDYSGREWNGGTQGPDLSRLGAKYADDLGREWVVDWIRDPARRAPRTIMPNSRLTATQAVHVGAYLLESDDWQCPEPPSLDEAALDELVFSHLSKVFSDTRAEAYLKQGIPESERTATDADELLGEPSIEKKLRYVGRRTIAKRGCYGCHDIPGFEDAPLIGPALSDWGRKQESLLAFEQVGEYMAAKNGSAAEDPEAKSRRAFFEDAVSGHRREGFLWQKLHEPRSFDYKKAEEKAYHELLTMGRFDLTDEQVERIAVFVLGLTADAPNNKSGRYVYSPSPREKARIEGRGLLTKYACARCHALAMERWTFEYDPEEFAPPIVAPDFAFLEPWFSRTQVEASRHVDRRGLGRACVVGMPMLDEEGELMEDEDDEGNPIYFVTPWEPALVNGDVWPAGGMGIGIARPRIIRKQPYDGGDFARWLYPVVVEEALSSGTSSSVAEAWGWLPPPLIGEGLKVRPQWLYEYLLDPAPIRPARVLNMPRYNLSRDEAATLTAYFAAVDGAESPYDRPTPVLAEADSEARKELLLCAMDILIDSKTYCAKCHLIGDYGPGGEITTTLAPNLADVHRRLRGEYLRRWLANPKAILPYTAMPVNFPPDGEPLGQDLLPGTSVEQLDAVTELLLRYERIMTRKAPIPEASSRARADSE